MSQALLDLEKKNYCLFMEASANQNDWDEREESVRTSNGGILPLYWNLEIYKKGVYAYTKSKWK